MSEVLVETVCPVEDRGVPAQGCYEERYRFTFGAKLGVLGGVLVLVIGLPAHPGTVVLLIFLVWVGITILPAVTGPASRRIVFRADQAGITLGASRQASRLFKRDPATFVSWADVEGIVIYPRPRRRWGRQVQCIGIQRRPGTLDLDEGSESAPNCPVPRVATGMVRPITGWRLDRDRLAAVTAAAAPGVPIIEIGVEANSRARGPLQG
jgi:hypothetical protein